ncbi:siderophore-interacting protein [Nakamurella endophytica]|uniref:FAD-binding FR-type domain-containing protein n=1 Tax=Nakamurella endophytica TaxID=1748367 RepID=A0A917SVU8_9ACTN|nr:siderophore-interacting protein [Nakamurella endophytica]GGL97954.1 hypothetical protein GCM10011594_17280 [Nakamurella endophytica]
MTVTLPPPARPDLRPAVEPAYRVFDVRVQRVRPLGHSFVRITLSGPDLQHFADNGDDQRIKLVLPLTDGGTDGYERFPRDLDWYAAWRSLPDERRNPLRTYTVRAVRHCGTTGCEVDVDMVLHGLEGPASRWASAARAGHRLLVVGPNRRCSGDTRAAAWAPQPSARCVLIGADETAVPAAAAILEGLPAHATGVAVLEIPSSDDRLPLSHPAGVHVRWLVRDGAPGVRLADAVVQEVSTLLPRASRHPRLDGGCDAADTEIVWEVPDTRAAATESPLYAWLAGEAQAITALRRRLVRDLGMDRRSVAFMGYWRQGRAEC